MHDFKTRKDVRTLISVVIPVYNTEKYLHKCINSILNQTYNNLEVILVDDGSTDSSPGICDFYKKNDTRVKVIHKENEGLSAARNDGIEIATGQYIAFVDSDDYIHTNMYESMMASMINDPVDICVCQWQYVCADGNMVVDANKIDSSMYGIKTSNEFAEYLYKGAYENGAVCAVWNKLYKKNIFDNTKFNGRYVEDDRIHNKILSQAYSVVVIPEQFYFYCENDDSLTNRPFNEENLIFLDVLCERIACFSENKFITVNTKKLYCNMYIEYYYKAKEANIKMPKIIQFDEITKNLIRNKEVNLKFVARMILFRISPKLYLKICKK